MTARSLTNQELLRHYLLGTTVYHLIPLMHKSIQPVDLSKCILQWNTNISRFEVFDQNQLLDPKYVYPDKTDALNALLSSLSATPSQQEVARRRLKDACENF
jgi:hypothetical protein